MPDTFENVYQHSKLSLGCTLASALTRVSYKDWLPGKVDLEDHVLGAQENLSEVQNQVEEPSGLKHARHAMILFHYL